MKKPASSSKSDLGGQTSSDEASLPLGVGESSGDGGDQSLDPLAAAGEMRRFKSSSLVIVVVIGVACGGLWFMRSLSHVAGANGTKTEAEETIERFLGGRDARGNSKATNQGTDPNVLAVLTESFTGRQVPLQDVKRNPFILPGEGMTIPVLEPVRGEDPEAALARLRTARQNEIDAAISRLALKSIIMSTQPLANISGTIVRIGDELAPEGSDVTLRVMSITNDAVVLVAEDLALGLHLEIPLSMKRDR